MTSSLKATTNIQPINPERVYQATARFAPDIQWRLLKATLLVNDAIFIAMAFVIAYLVRFNLAWAIFDLKVPTSNFYYFRIGVALIVLWLVAFYANNLYKRQHLLGGSKEYALVFRSVSAGMLFVMVAGFLYPDFYLARGWLLMAWVGSFVLVGFGRFFIRRIVYALRRTGYFLTPSLIIGANQEGLSLAAQLQSWQTSGLYLMGFFDPNRRPGPSGIDGLPILGNLDQLESFVETHQIQELILATSAIHREQMLKIFQTYGMQSKVNLRKSSGVFEILTTGLEINELAYVPLVRVRKVRLTDFDQFTKFLLDYSVALFALLPLLPLMGLLSLLIKLDSSGPAIYRRRVYGLNGKQFDAFKFRTMYTNGDEILAQYPDKLNELRQTHKIIDDPRITRVGNFIRKYSLDELPQLFNVIRREMSLVGPRMISPPEMAKYEQHGMNLLTVLPGITGLWQVSGRSNIAYAERVRLDMHYIRNWSIWLDLQLLFQTIPAVLTKRGAY